MSDLGFPSNVLDILEERLVALMPPLEDPNEVLPNQPYPVVQRPLRLTDPQRCGGVYVANWNPVEESHEIGQEEATLNRWNYRIQNLVKHGDETVGRSLFAVDAKVLRAILYRDNQLVVALSSLTDEILGSRERYKRLGVRSQRFLTNELRGTMHYLSVTDLWVETETVEL
jgi:hypothetical protein